MITPLIKAVLRAVATAVKKNYGVKKYLFDVALKDELADYYDHEYYQGYAHINKAMTIARRTFRAGEVIVDVGGADGTTPTLFASNFPGTTVWVFEPIAENIRAIERIAASTPAIRLIPKAVGSTEGSSVIHKAERITSSSLFELNNDKDSAVFADILKETGTETISLTTLDATIPSDQTVMILKIDVQGYELEVLTGGAATLARTRLIVLEMNNHDGYKGAPKYYTIDEHLRAHGFLLFDMFPSLKDNGQLKEWDAIYINTRL